MSRRPIHRPSASCRDLAFFNVSPETAGDAYSINVGHFFIRDAARPFASRHAPSMRAIYDLADPDRSLFMHSTGQSGNFLSPWYGNFAERWAKVAVHRDSDQARIHQGRAHPHATALNRAAPRRAALS
jgi:penicillin amidase